MSVQLPSTLSMVTGEPNELLGCTTGVMASAPIVTPLLHARLQCPLLHHPKLPHLSPAAPFQQLSKPYAIMEYLICKLG
jgi:hypothetical protein